MNKDLKIYTALFVIVILLIGGIYYFRNNADGDEKVMKCIASKSVLYMSKTCPHCQGQKEVLGDYLSLFKTVDCFYEIEECRNANITGFPTWVINDKYYLSEMSIDELARLTGCKECKNQTVANVNCNVSETCIQGLEGECE